MQQHILTDFTIPVKVEEFDGEITLLEAKFWPDWETPKFHHLFSYTRSGKPVIVPVIDGKRYTFEDIQHAIHDHLNMNIAINDRLNQVATLYYNNENRQVTWRIATKQAGEAKLSDIKLSPGLIDMLKLKKADNLFFHMVSEPIDKSSINFCFSNASTLFLDCREIDDTYVDGKETKTLGAVPVNSTFYSSFFTLDLQHPVVAAYHNNYLKELNFRVVDEHGNNLPLKQALLRFIINDERISRQNLP